MRLKYKIKNWFNSTYLYRYIFSAITHPKNFIFCTKYPFWKVKNRMTGKFLGYSFTEYSFIPSGWQIAFGKQLSEAIVSALKEDKISKKEWSKNVTFYDIKEKWGYLVLDAAATDTVQKVLTKYEYMSIGYCINCGKPARYKSTGYIEYLCEDCFRKISRCSTAAYKKYRLSQKDMPEVYTYEKGKEKKISLKDKYDIDYKKLWGLK